VSSVLSIRIPRKLKEEMDKLREFVDWKTEIISFIEMKVKYYKKLKALDEVNKILDKLPKAPRGTAARLVRMDRDSH